MWGVMLRLSVLSPLLDRALGGGWGGGGGAMVGLVPFGQCRVGRYVTVIAEH